MTIAHTQIAGIVACLLLTIAPAAHADDVKVFLLGGQSNMDGRAQDADLPAHLQGSQNDVLFFHQDGNNTLGTLQTGSGDDFGPELSFGFEIKQTMAGETIALIKHAEGGTNLWEDWDPNGSGAYQRFKHTVSLGLAALQAAGHNTEIVGMLWHQGESDANVDHANDYEANLTAFIGDVRNEYGADLPFLAGEIRRRNDMPESFIVSDAIMAVAAADPHTYFVPANDLTFDGVHSWHFDGAGAVTLGERYAAAFASSQSVPEPSSLIACVLVSAVVVIVWGRRSRAAKISPS